MVHYITRTALRQLIEAGNVFDCAEGYGSYVIALTTARFGEGLGTILLVKWHETEYWANRMAGHFELENLEPGWDGAYEVEVWYVMEDDWYDVDPVFDPDRPSGQVYQVLALDENDEMVSTTYRSTLYTAVMNAQMAVRYDDDVDHVIINDFSTGRVVRVEEWSAWDSRFYDKLIGVIRDAQEYAEHLRQLRVAGAQFEVC